MKQEGEPEETVRITRVEMSETLVEEMACEEKKVVEERRVGAQQRVRWSDMAQEQEGKEEESGENQRECVGPQDEMVKVQEQGR